MYVYFKKKEYINDLNKMMFTLLFCRLITMIFGNNF